MAKINNFKEFCESSYEKNESYSVLRTLELTKEIESNYTERYAIQITFSKSAIPELLLEHKVINAFNSTRNRYMYHPADPKIPVRAHYHIYPPNGKKELYAVNVDGTAHHQKNKGIELPRKEAEELRAMGVQIAFDNILESIEIIQTDAIQLITENHNQEEYYSIFIMIG